MKTDDVVTNRRGRPMSDKREVTPELTPDLPKAMTPKMSFTHPRRQKRVSRALRRRIVLVVVSVIAIPIVCGELIRFTYVTEVKQAQKTAGAVLADYQRASFTATDLQSAATKIAAQQDSLCSGGFFDNAATLYPRSNQALQDCTRYREKLAALQANVKEAVAQMAYAEKLQPLLGNVSKPLTDQFVVFTAQQENWQNCVENMKQLSVPVSFSQPHAQLLAQAEIIRDQWIALVQAANAYDSPKYTEARTKLSTAYAEFQKQAAVFKTSVEQVQASLLIKTRSL